MHDWAPKNAATRLMSGCIYHFELLSNECEGKAKRAKRAKKAKDLFFALFALSASLPAFRWNEPVPEAVNDPPVTAAQWSDREPDYFSPSGAFPSES
jgi:hypothetical protein